MRRREFITLVGGVVMLCGRAATKAAIAAAEIPVSLIDGALNFAVPCGKREQWA